MTNHEHFKKDINKLSAATIIWGFGDGGIKRCNDMDCDECQFYSVGASCELAKLKWMDEEYKESEIDWSNVPIDTKILVSDGGKDWLNRHFAGINPANKKPRAWVAGRTSFTSDPRYDIKSWNYAKLAEEE